MRYDSTEAPLHGPQANAQVLLLAGQRRFQDAFENLLMAELQSLLNSLIRI
jgi:hypothetical protein